jgi:hypothetical protein
MLEAGQRHFRNGSADVSLRPMQQPSFKISLESERRYLIAEAFTGLSVLSVCRCAGYITR